MKVYLVEISIDDVLEPVLICKSLKEAKKFRCWQLITEIEVGKKYNKGIGHCRHWHYYEEKE